MTTRASEDDTERSKSVFFHVAQLGADTVFSEQNQLKLSKIKSVIFTGKKKNKKRHLEGCRIRRKFENEYLCKGKSWGETDACNLFDPVSHIITQMCLAVEGVLQDMDRHAK